MCYAKASNKSGVGSKTMVSGGTTAGPPMPPPPVVTVALASTQPVATTEPTYASWNIDSSCNRGFHHINWTNPNLIAAAKALAPSRLRFGGSGNDALVYGLSEGSVECSGIVPPSQGYHVAECGYTTPGCLNSTHWDNLHAFSQASGADFIFGLSIGLPQACAARGRYVWNATNAITLLRYVAAHNQTIWGYELGNEVNNNGEGTPCNLTATMQAKAALHLSELVAHTSAKIIGPDTGYRHWQEWLEKYLPVFRGAKVGLLHAVTHHVYPGVGRTSFNRPQTLDSTRKEIDWWAWR